MTKNILVVAAGCLLAACVYTAQVCAQAEEDAAVDSAGTQVEEAAPAIVIEEAPEQEQEQEPAGETITAEAQETEGELPPEDALPASGAEKNLDNAPVNVLEKPRRVNMNQLITLDLRSMDVNDALTYISLRSGANIVASKAVTGRVTLQLKDVSIQDVFDITLITNGLAYEKYGDIYYVMTEQEYEARYGKKFADIRKVRTYQLKYAIPEKAFDLLDTLKSSIGRILVDQESGTILMVDTEEKLNEMEATLQTLEQKGNVNIFNLQYALATDVEARLKTQLDDKNVGSIWSDERSNQVIVRALPDRMLDVKEIIAALDKKTLEVLIDAKIVQVQLSDSLQTGFEWEGMFEELFDSAGGGFVGSHPLNPVERLNQTFIDDFTTIQPEDANPSAGSKVTPGKEIFFGSVDKNHSFEAVMKFLATLGETRLLSNPKLAVVNNQEARIHVGRQEAYITSTTTAGQTTTTTAEDVTFVNVGIQLSVTPTINDEGFVTMKIKPEISSVVDTLVTPSGNQIPIIDTSLAETTVLVKDASTIIIGGLRRDEETENSERIPFLGDLPLLGNLFRNQTKATQRNELLVMITPHIVDGTRIYSGDIDDPDNQPTKTFKDYDEYDTISETYGPDFGRLDYKPFR
ncbi:MAG: hypothetical protein A3C36_01785 [Omnitrophica WOR_2 bacterium RIFCSPHIGHO2_02_FULL_52_10]|nr:MAG: hypothetical protein A3C36_01785 [Omnitrophica WOR_2 bacterium RIFCSPHIGHO2_02_FULL_52_10]